MQKYEKTIIECAAENATEIRSIILKAGDAVMSVYSRDFDVELKADSSPVTEADFASQHIISIGLKGLESEIGRLPMISEEDEIPDYDTRKHWKAWWLIDPLDGTKDFVRRGTDFTVNIGLILRDEKSGLGRPLAGWVFAPVKQLLYQGIVGKGAIRMTDTDHAKECESILPKGSHLDPPKIVASSINRNAHTERIISAVGSEFGEGELVCSSSSLKLCRVAEGSADLYPRTAATMEWDTGAADAVCRAAGVRVVQAVNGENLNYGKKDLLNPWFLVSFREDLIRVSMAALILP